LAEEKEEAYTMDGRRHLNPKTLNPWPCKGLRWMQCT
jgi:hypothetical protein